MSTSSPQKAEGSDASACRLCVKEEVNNTANMNNNRQLQNHLLGIIFYIIAGCYNSQLITRILPFHILYIPIFEATIKYCNYRKNGRYDAARCFFFVSAVLLAMCEYGYGI